MRTCSDAACKLSTSFFFYGCGCEICSLCVCVCFEEIEVMRLVQFYCAVSCSEVFFFFYEDSYIGNGFSV